MFSPFSLIVLVNFIIYDGQSFKLTDGKLSAFGSIMMVHLFAIFLVIQIFLKKGQKETGSTVPVSDLVFYDNICRTVSLKGRHDLMVRTLAENFIYKPKSRVL